MRKCRRSAIEPEVVIPHVSPLDLSAPEPTGCAREVHVNVRSDTHYFSGDIDDVVSTPPLNITPDIFNYYAHLMAQQIAPKPRPRHTIDYGTLDDTEWQLAKEKCDAQWADWKRAIVKKNFKWYEWWPQWLCGVYDHKPTIMSKAMYRTFPNPKRVEAVVVRTDRYGVKHRSHEHHQYHSYATRRSDRHNDILGYVWVVCERCGAVGIWNDPRPGHIEYASSWEFRWNI